MYLCVFVLYGTYYSCIIVDTFWYSELLLLAHHNPSSCRVCKTPLLWQRWLKQPKQPLINASCIARAIPMTKLQVFFWHIPQCTMCTKYQIKYQQYYYCEPSHPCRKYDFPRYYELLFAPYYLIFIFFNFLEIISLQPPVIIITTLQRFTGK